MMSLFLTAQQTLLGPSVLLIALVFLKEKVSFFFITVESETLKWIFLIWDTNVFSGVKNVKIIENCVMIAMILLTLFLECSNVISEF